MYKLIFLLGLFLSSLVHANLTYECFFTEPFISVNVIASNDTFVQKGDKVDFLGLNSSGVAVVNDKSETNGILSLTFDSFETGKYILEINLLIRGSDGMSDKIYNFESILKRKDGRTIVIGGCNLVND